jgi:hypothetical protein
VEVLRGRVEPDRPADGPAWATTWQDLLVNTVGPSGGHTARMAGMSGAATDRGRVGGLRGGRWRRVGPGSEPGLFVCTEGCHVPIRHVQ